MLNVVLTPVRIIRRWVKSYVKLLPESGLALLAFALLLPLCGLVQLFDPAANVSCIHSGGVVWLRKSFRVRITQSEDHQECFVCGNEFKGKENRAFQQTFTCLKYTQLPEISSMPWRL